MKAKKKVKKVKLPATHVAHIEVPPDMIPTIVPGPEKHIVGVVPVPKEESWWDFLFGTKKYKS